MSAALACYLCRFYNGRLYVRRRTPRKMLLVCAIFGEALSYGGIYVVTDGVGAGSLFNIIDAWVDTNALSRYQIY